MYKRGRPSSNVYILSRIHLYLHETKSVVNSPGYINRELIKILIEMSEQPTLHEPTETDRRELFQEYFSL